MFNLRPRRTAVVITVLTGSLISALSLGLLLLVSRQLRVGLFELNDLEARLRSSRSDLKGSRKAQRKARQQLEEARADEIKARKILADAQARAGELRSTLQPLQEQTRRLEAERQRLSQCGTAMRKSNARMMNFEQCVNASAQAKRSSSNWRRT